MKERWLVSFAWLAGCGGDGVHHLPDAPPPADAPIDAPACPPATGAGTMHGGSINAAETWAAAGSPHLVPSDISVNAPLTIEAARPC